MMGIPLQIAVTAGAVIAAVALWVKRERGPVCLCGHHIALHAKGPRLGSACGMQGCLCSEGTVQPVQK
jgi:hypothetical protein